MRGTCFGARETAAGDSVGANATGLGRSKKNTLLAAETDDNGGVDDCTIIISTTFTSMRWLCIWRQYMGARYKEAGCYLGYFMRSAQWSLCPVLACTQCVVASHRITAPHAPHIGNKGRLRSAMVVAA